jgi:hypothetical protein
VKFLKEYYLSLKVLKCEEHHVGEKLPLSRNGRITVCPVGETQRLQERGSSSLFRSLN